MVQAPQRVDLDQLLAADREHLIHPLYHPADHAKPVVVVRGEGAESVDLLIEANSFERLASPRIVTANTHGTGCTLSSAIAGGLAKGRNLATAVREAKSFVAAAIAASGRLRIGGGQGPVHHCHKWW